MTETVEAIRREVVVPSAQQRAFEVFTAEIDELVAGRSSHRQRADRGDHHRVAGGWPLVHPPPGRHRDLDRLRQRVGAI